MKYSKRSVSIGLLLGGLFLLFQYALWFHPSGLLALFQLKHQLAEQKQKNEALLHKNQRLFQEISVIRKDPQFVASAARKEFGMIHSGEQFYRVVKKDDQDTVK